MPKHRITSLRCNFIPQA